MTNTSLGPWGHIVMQGETAMLVDVPYYSEDLVKEVREVAPLGVTHLLFTHDDFVGMSGHASWKAAFPDAVRVACSTETPKGSMEVELTGSGPWDVAGFRVCYAPGHSRGSVFYALAERSAVLTGDGVGLWQGDATGFPSRNRFGRATQAESLRRYARTAAFTRAVLPSHGLPAYFQDEQELQAFFEVAADGLDGGNRSLRSLRTQSQ